MTVSGAWMQAEAWTPQLERVMGFFSELQDIDVSGVAPSMHASPDEEAHMREDVAVVHPMADKFLDTVPEREGDLIKVPKISTAAD